MVAEALLFYIYRRRGHVGEIYTSKSTGNLAARPGAISEPKPENVPRELQTRLPEQFLAFGAKFSIFQGSNPRTLASSRAKSSNPSFETANPNPRVNHLRGRPAPKPRT